MPEIAVAAATTSETVLSASAQRSFREYLADVPPENRLNLVLGGSTYFSFKAFAVDPSTGDGEASWLYDYPPSAIDRALVACKRRAQRDCKLYAIGDIIVFDLPEWQLALAISLYKSKHDATNDDLRALLATAGGSDAQGLGGLKRAVWVSAASRGNTAAVKALLDLGMDVNVTSEVGATALMYAASRGRKDTVRLLLASGADLAVKNSVGRTALQLALMAQNFAELRDYLAEDHQETIRMLKKAGAKE